MLSDFPDLESTTSIAGEENTSSPGVGRSASSSLDQTSEASRATTMQSDQSGGGPGGGSEVESEPVRLTSQRLPTPKYASVAVHMPIQSADELHELALSSGLAFKHLTSVALAIGVGRLRRQLVGEGEVQ
jgi:hypothetical protein